MNSDKNIDLVLLAGAERYQKISALEDDKAALTRTVVRGVALDFHTTTRRQLWQALGHEYIEPELLDFIDTLPAGGVLYDIGASNGIFALYAARKGMQVFCFEPEAQNFALLERNAYLNYRYLESPCSCFNVALSDQNGLGKIFISKYEPGGHMKILDKPVKVQETEAFQPEYIQSVLKFRLDHFIEFSGIPAPHYLKIDVDGAEAAVIGGATQTLRNPALKKIFIELEDGSNNTNRVLSALTAVGFSIEKSCQVQHYVGLSNIILSR